MAQPPPYDRQFNFQNQQLQTPADPPPADEMDAEYNAIKLTLDVTLANLKLIQRDDGQLANASVGEDQLKPELVLLGNAAADVLVAAAEVEADRAEAEASKNAAGASATTASGAASSASASASAAAASKTAAETAELNAENAEINAGLAQTQAQAAAVDAVAAAAKLSGSSITSVTIGTGSKAFTTQAGKFFNPGVWVLITSNAAPATNYMHGVVTAYVGTALTVDVTNIGGSGTLVDWTIHVSGTQGPIGPTGATGATGSPGASGAPGVQFAFSATTTDSDPGNGVFRFNNATPSSATAMYVDNLETTGTSVAAWLDSFDDAGDSTNRGALQIIDPNNTANFYVFVVTGSVVDGTGYRKLTISYLSGAGAFTPAALISFAFFRRGPIGATGPAVADGDKGDITVSASGATYTIDNDVVTYAKMQNVSAADRVLGRVTAGAGDVEEITVTAAGRALIDDASADAQLTTLGATAAGKSVLTAADAAAQRIALGGVFSSVVLQKFTASGTYTPTAGMKYCIIECVGGGGGGGGVAGVASQYYIAGGGGSGGYSRARKTAADIGASKTVTIGAAGSAGAAGDNNGGAGGDTSVGTLVIALGGAGGSKGSVRDGVLGGLAGTGDITAAGTPGTGGFINLINTSIGTRTGDGGSSYFGGGAPAGSGTGVAASNYGSGGSGATAAAAVNVAGGAGSAGLVVITEFI